MQSNRSNETVRIGPATANRSNELPRVSPLQQASGMPLLPTSRPARARRRSGPINPIYLLLVTVLPLAILGSMVWAAAGLFPHAEQARPFAVAVITPASDLA